MIDVNDTLSIMTVLKSGGEYRPIHVQLLLNMIKRNSTVPFRFFCLTDYFFESDGIECIPLKYGWPRWWSKIELFRPDLKNLPGRFLFFDLDTIVCKNIDPLLNAHSEFAYMRGIGSLASEQSTAIMAYSQSDYLYSIFDTFHHDAEVWIERFRSDQDFVNAVYNLPPGWIQDFYPAICSYQYHWVRRGERDAGIIIFHGTQRPWTAAVKDPSIAELYQ